MLQGNRNRTSNTDRDLLPNLEFGKTLADLNFAFRNFDYVYLMLLYIFRQTIWRNFKQILFCQPEVSNDLLMIF